jgi:hypothetical protein
MRRFAVLLVLPALALAVYDTVSLGLNDWSCTFTNYGTWGHDNGNPGGSWQGGWYIFGAGIWVGGVTSGGDTLVTMGYNPNSGASEMFPTLTRHWREGTGDARDRVYVYPGDWPAPPDRFPMAPTVIDADVQAWSAACDSSPSRHIPPGVPIGFDLCTTVYADTAPEWADFFYLRCAISNPSDDSLVDLHVGIICDADVGNANDDLCGVILDREFAVGPDTFRVRNTGYAYSQDQTPPGAVAVRYLSGPLGDSITALKIFTLDNDPTTDAQQFMTLAGYDWQTSQYNPFDTVDLVPDDKRLLIAAGTFALAPNDTAVCWFAVIGAAFTPSDTSQLAYAANVAYEHGLTLLGVTAEPAVSRPAGLRLCPSLVRVGQVVRFMGMERDPAVTVFDAAGRIRAVVRSELRTADFAPGVYLLRSGSRYAKLVIE